MSSEFRNIRSAAIDGRMHNPFFKKEQLNVLHKALCNDSESIQNGLVRDYQYTQAEAKVEFWLAANSIKGAFESIDPKTVLQDEYAIANSKDSPHTREPVGVILIELSENAFFYGLFSALAPAIANGNCVIVQTEGTFSPTAEKILLIVAEALDNDIFQTTHSRVRDENIGARFIRINQTPNNPPRAIAIIERDANIQLAAEALVSARFSRRGKSPYAPDLILVNEWVKKEFLSASIQEASKFIPDSKSSSDMSNGTLNGETANDGYSDIVFSTSGGTIFNVQSRQSSAFNKRLDGRSLAVHSVTSMDDAIDLSRSFGRLASVYIFTSAPTAKYISQFVDANAAFVNHIPTNLLYAPILPDNTQFRLQSYTLYDENQFNIAKPQYSKNTEVNQRLQKLLFSASSQELQKLESEATKPLQDIKRPDKLVRLGFFEQGIVTGAVLVLSGIIISLTTLTYHGHQFIKSR